MIIISLLLCNNSSDLKYKMKELAFIIKQMYKRWSPFQVTPVKVPRSSLLRDRPLPGFPTETSLCFHPWTHLMSELELSRRAWSRWSIMWSFSVTHSLHSPPMSRPFTCSKMFHFMVNSVLLSFRSQTCLVSSHDMAWLRCLMPWLWTPSRSLNETEVSPTYGLLRLSVWLTTSPQ